MAKNIEHEKCKFLVSFFCGKIDTNFWAREIKIAKKLIKEHPETDLWEKMVFKCKLPSLAFFLTEDGQNMMKKHFAIKKLVLPEKPEYNLDKETKIQEIAEVSKPKTIFNFLNS